MERGPVALFGAIVAVGLGPALWLGAQFGRFDATPPPAPAAVDRQHTADKTQLMGGTGGGEDPTGVDNNTQVRSTSRAHVVPLTTTPTPSPSSSTDPSASAPGPGGSSPTGGSSASPSQSASPSSPSDGDGHGNGGGNDSQPPSPPAGNGGSGGSGGGDVNPTGSPQTVQG